MLSATILKIVNSTSVALLNVRYEYANFETIEAGGEKSFVFLKSVDKMERIHFEVNTKYELIKLKTESISLDVGKTFTYTITYKTFLIRNDNNKTDTLKNILNLRILKIVNETGCVVKNLKIKKKTYNVTLEQGATWEFATISYEKLESLEFDFVTNIYTFKVKTKEEILGYFDEDKIFTLTHNTPVYFEFGSGSYEIGNLLNAIALKVVNNTSAQLLDMFYGGDVGKIEPHSEKTIICVSGWLNIDNFNVHFFVETKNGKVGVYSEKINVNSDRTATYTITNDTLVKRGDMESYVSMNTFFGGCVLKVVDKTFFASSYLINVKIAGKNHKEVLKDGKSWIFEFDSAIEVILEATVKSTTVKVKEKINLESGKMQTFKIEDETPVLIEGSSKAIELQKVPEVSIMKIVNNTSTKLLNLKFSGYNLTEVETYCEDSFLCDRFMPSVHIFFEIKSRNKIFKLRTKERFSLSLQEQKEYIITDNTTVIMVYTNQEVLIRNILRECTLNVVNKTSAKIKNIRYSNKIHEYELDVDEVCKFEFNDKAEDLFY